MTTAVEAAPAHATLGPSKADMWINCPASIAMGRKAPKAAGSFAAAEGQVAHDLAYRFATGKIDSLEMGLLVGTIVRQEGFDVPVTDEMLDGAFDYKDLLDKLRAELHSAGKHPPLVEHGEKRVHAPSVDDEVWGTTDWAMWIVGHKLIVVDYKFGAGVMVDPEENEQGALYLIGVIDSLAKSEAFGELEIVIHQPRGRDAQGPVKRWVVPKGWLAEFRARAKAAAAETRSPTALIKAGDHCRWCPAKPFCPEVHKAAQEAAMTTFDAIAPAEVVKAADLVANVRLMSLAQIGKMLTHEGMVKALFSAAKDVMLEKLSAGETDPNWKLVTGREGNREWVDEAKVVAEFAPVLGEDKLYKPKELLSPAAIERIVGKKHKIDHLVSRKPGEKAIARSHDPRPAVASAAQDAFSVIETTAVKAECLGCELGGCEDHKTGAEPAEPKKREPVWPQ